MATSISSGSTTLLQQMQSLPQRAADLAAQRAKSLQTQARQARAAADRAQAEATALEMKAVQAQATATEASFSLHTTASFATVQNTASDVYSVVPQVVLRNNQPAIIRGPTEKATTSASTVKPVLGSVINTTA